MSTSFQLNVDGFTKQALQLCGLLRLGGTPSNQLLQDARDLFSVMLKTLQARGVTLTQAVRRSLTLTSGTASYALPTDVIDVEFPTMLQASGSNEETYVEKMVYSDYQVISNKQVSGVPTRAYVEKLASCSVTFWEIPNGTYTWNYRAIVLVPDMSDGATEPGLTQRWMGALLWRFAYWLAHANNLNPAKRLELKTEAEQQERDVMGQENERGDLHLSLPPDPYGSYY
jgi:hypothetical protein